jgi:glyoxylate reductase
MKSTAVLINTARGPVVDETALVEALRAGRIASAGLDVYEREPELAAGLAQLPNCTLLPHLGSATTGTRARMGHLALDGILDVLAGRAPAHPVNQPARSSS